MLLWLPTIGAAEQTFACSEAVVGNHNSIRFQQILAHLKTQGLKELLRDIEGGQIAVEYRQKTWPWQSDVTWSVRLGRKYLIVRDLQWNTRLEQQRSTWSVARTLYQLQLDRTLLTRTRALGHELSLPLTWRDTDDLLTHFFIELPLARRAELKARVQALREELHTLAKSLDLLKGRELSRGNLERYFRSAMRTLIASVALSALQLVTTPESPSLFEATEVIATISPEEIQTRVVDWRNTLAAQIKLMSEDATADQELRAIYLRDLTQLYADFPYLRCIPEGTVEISDLCQVN